MDNLRWKALVHASLLVIVAITVAERSLPGMLGYPCPPGTTIATAIESFASSPEGESRRALLLVESAATFIEGFIAARIDRKNAQSNSLVIDAVGVMLSGTPLRHWSLLIGVAGGVLVQLSASVGGYLAIREWCRDA